MVQSRHACGRVRPQGGAGAREQPLARARPASVGRPEEGCLPALRSREVWRRDWYMRVHPYAGPSSSASMDIDRGNLVWHITSFDAARARALWHGGGVGPTGGQARGRRGGTTTVPHCDQQGSRTARGEGASPPRRVIPVSSWAGPGIGISPGAPGERDA